MDYLDVRPEIKSGDILAFSHVGWKTWHDWKIQAVRMATRSLYSHVATAWVVGGRVLVIEAVQPLVRIFPLSKLGDFYWVPMNAPWSPAAEAKAMSAVGEKYSQIQAIESFFGEPKKDNLWQCCEFTKTVAETDGIIIDCHPTPANIMQTLQEMGKTINFVKNPEL
jgi:hypothetical protein